MTQVVADTHGLVWWLWQPSRLSPAAERALDESERSGGILVPSIVLVELVYLVEKNRLPESILQRVLTEAEDPQRLVQIVPLDRHIATAIRTIPRNSIPDMPDRIIAATALHLGLPLVSRDQKILDSAVTTIW